MSGLPLLERQILPVAHTARRQGAASDWLKLLRVKQWTKNLIVLLPILFAAKVQEAPLLVRACFCLLAFCLVSSAVYALNDVLDRKKDRLHPIKKQRPLAANRLSVRQALCLSIVLAALGLTVAFLVRPTLALVCLAYILLMVGYSTFFKYIALLDVFSIASGFVLRAVGGAVAAFVPCSAWFLLCTSFGALFLALEKRRHELKFLQAEAGAHRQALNEYSEDLLSRSENIVLSSLVTCYAFYSFQSYHGQGMLATLPFVVYGIMRYQALSVKSLHTGSPEEALFKDRPLQITIVLWLLTAATVIYGVFPAALAFIVQQIDAYSVFK